MGPSSIRIAVFFGALVAVGVVRADEAVLRLPKDSCAGFMDDLKDDVGLDGKKGRKNLIVPYVEKALRKIYRVVAVEGLSAEDEIKNVVEGGVRQNAFKIETIGKALEEYDKGFAVLREEGTLLENAVGDYESQVEMLEFLKTDPTYSKLLTPEAEAFFQGRITAARDAYRKNRARWKWDDSRENAFWRIFRKVEKSGLTRKRDLKGTLLDFMADSLERTHNKIRTGKFSPNEIEDGVHKTRRMLREVLIVMGDFEGLFFLDERIGVKGVRTLGVKTSEKYLLKEDHLEKYAVGVPKDGFIYMLELIQRFGELKDTDGIKLNAFAALSETSHPFGSDTKALIAALDPKGAAKSSIEATRKEAAVDFKNLVESEFLLNMAKALRKAKD